MCSKGERGTVSSVVVSVATLINIVVTNNSVCPHPPTHPPISKVKFEAECRCRVVTPLTCETASTTGNGYFSWLYFPFAWFFRSLCVWAGRTFSSPEPPSNNIQQGKKGNSESDVMLTTTCIGCISVINDSGGVSKMFLQKRREKKKGAGFQSSGGNNSLSTPESSIQLSKATAKHKVWAELNSLSSLLCQQSKCISREKNPRPWTKSMLGFKNVISFTLSARWDLVCLYELVHVR